MYENPYFSFMRRNIFSHQFAYSDISEDEFFDLYESAVFLLRPQNLLFALDPEGREIGFLFTLPDESRKVRAMAGSSGLAANLRFLLAPRETGRMVFKTVGVLPGKRKMHAGAALMNEAERIFARE